MGYCDPPPPTGPLYFIADILNLFIFFSFIGPAIEILIPRVSTNPCMPNGISHPYQFDESISISRGVGLYQFHSKSTFYKQTLVNLIWLSVASDLVLH